MGYELTFDYIRDKVNIDTRKKLSRIMKAYDLSNKEAEELLIASYNYDYEINEGVIITNIDSIKGLFTQYESMERIKPNIKQLKAMAMYIKETKKYYLPYHYEEYTKKVIDSILKSNDKEITKEEKKKEKHKNKEAR